MKKACIVLLLAAAVLVPGCTFVQIPLFPETTGLEETVLEGTGAEKILLLDLSGFISDEKITGGIFQDSPSLLETVRESLDKAAQDGNIRGLLLRVNSPGGTITSSDILRHEILDWKKKRRVPVVACLMDTATSGAYYVASAADEIVAHPTTITGSFAVIAMKINARGLLEKIGIEEETYKSGDLKDMGSPFRPSTAEERKIMGDIVASLHQRFAQVILEGRPSLKEKDLPRIMDGRIFTADQALKEGLVDRIGYLGDGIGALKSRIGLKEASIVTYGRPGSYRGTIYSSALTPSWDGGSLLAMGKRLSTGIQLLYLWTP
ncbi:MAG TPA: signal peptide peptidase SppA [Syntrophales bacterium]|nr:signal peptide peptidase SppA [Syntrophales bacterium]HQB30443.1 signal peptide peptidase SppA [Syntrophales bacterium]